MSIWDCPVFKAGDKVKCLNASGYGELKEGSTYTIAAYDPRLVTPNFTFPAYVVIEIDDRKIWCHAHRFTKELT